MADRYTGRHVRQARHGAWLNQRRPRWRPNGQLLPAAAALTVAGVLIGGAGLAIQLNPPSTGTESVAAYDAANFPPPDRDAATGHTSRDDTRATSSTVTANKPAGKPANNGRSTNSSGSASVISSGSCQASFYDEPQMTADGETFDPEALTAANKTLPFNSRVRVTNPANGKSVVVRINDRGPYVSGRCLDLSRAAFREIASLGQGVVNVRYEVLGKGSS